MTTLLQKLDEEFDKNPHDSKFLIVAPRSRKASWWAHASRYEEITVIKRGTYFYSTRERRCDDGRSRKKINPQQFRHVGLEEPASRYYCDKTDHDISILFRGVDTPVRINPAMLFHLRLAHFSDKFARWVVEGGIETGLDIKLSDITEEKCFCKSCKSQRLLQNVKATHQDFSQYAPFEYVCMDGSGPMPFDSLHGNRYVWAIMCLSTRWVKLYYSKNKTQKDIIKIFKRFQAYVAKWRRVISTFGLTAKLLTDLGGEFTGNEIARLLEQDGIRHIFAATAMHHQNAHVERLFRTIWNAMNKMMFTGDTPPFLWEEVCTHVVFIRNRLGYAALKWRSPFYMCEGRESHDFKRLKIFYSPCWPVTDSYYNKFSATIAECKWVGLSEDVRGTIVYRPSDKKIFTAGMLTTFENPTEVGKLLNDRNLTAFDIQDSSAYKSLTNVPRDLVHESHVRTLSRIVSSRAIWHEHDEEHYALLRIVSRSNTTPYWITLAALNNSEQGSFFQQIYDYVLREDSGTAFPLFSLVTLIKTDGAVPMPGIVCAYNKRSSYQFQVALEDGSIQYYKNRQIKEFNNKFDILFTSSLTVTQVGGDELNKIWPKNRAEAQKRHDWPAYEAAENEEIKRFTEMKFLVDFQRERPKGVFIHGSRFVYQVHYHTDGTLNKHRVRFVIQGFTMLSGRDFTETFAPVTQMVSMKLFYVIVLWYQFENRVYDVKSAYLNTTMDTEIWAKLPNGFTYDGCEYARVDKAVPGVKQGAYLWWVKFRKSLESSGFLIQDVEPCLFIFWKDKICCILLIHTDNIMVGSNNYDWWECQIAKWPFTTERVHTESVLGLHCERTAWNTMTFSQPQYIKDMVEEFGLTNSKIKRVPIRFGIENDYNPDTMSRNIDPSIPYRRLNMKLYWVARCYRAQIMYACNFFARFSHCYTQELFNEMLDTVLYLKATIDWKLVFKVDPARPLVVTFCCDASYSNVSEQKSSYGCLGWVQDCLVYTQSSTLNIRTTSSTESESNAIFQTCKAAIYVRNWLRAFTRVPEPMFVFNDSTSAIQILGSRTNANLSKHFSPRLRYVTELVETRQIQLFHIPRGMNGADILTHSLARTAFEHGVTLIYGDVGARGLLEFAAHSGGELEFASNMARAEPLRLPWHR